MAAEQKQGERGRNCLSLSEETLLGKTIIARNLYSVLAVLQGTNITSVSVTGFKGGKMYHYGVKVCIFMIG
jgi:hypothetical protein